MSHKISIKYVNILKILESHCHINKFGNFMRFWDRFTSRIYTNMFMLNIICEYFGWTAHRWFEFNVSSQLYLYNYKIPRITSVMCNLQANLSVNLIRKSLWKTQYFRLNCFFLFLQIACRLFYSSLPQIYPCVSGW